MISVWCDHTLHFKEEGSGDMFRQCLEFRNLWNANYKAEHRHARYNI